MSTKETQQLQLSYEVIEAVAGRTYLRENFKRAAIESYTTRFMDIQIREGFNHRIEYEEIAELADSIFQYELQNPLRLDVLPDGRVFLDEGHRRYKAMELLVKGGRWQEDHSVEFFANKAKVTEIDRVIRQYTSNNLQKPYTPLEQSSVAYSLKHDFGNKPTHDEIGKMLSVSRQKVDMLILYAEQPDDVKAHIRLSGMSFTAGVDYIRSLKKLSAQADNAEMEQAQTGMYVSGTKDELSKEMKELEDLENMEIPGEVDNTFDKAALDHEKLLQIANEFTVSQEILASEIGKRLAADALSSWEEYNVDKDTAEVINIASNSIVLGKGAEITEDNIKRMMDAGVKTVFVYKEIVPAPSVITEAVAREGKEKYDSNRIEIQQIQNAIKLADKIEFQISKLDVPEGVKTDIEKLIQWQQKDLAEVREYVHLNKKQNKRGS